MRKENSTIKILGKTYSGGFGAMPFAVLRGKLPKHLKLLYLDLLSYAWDEARCFPGHSRLAKDMGVTRRQIVADLKELKKLGLVDWAQTIGDSNIYTVNELPVQFYPSKLELGNNKTGEGVKQTSQGGVKQTSHQVDEYEIDEFNKHNKPTSDEVASKIGEEKQETSVPALPNHKRTSIRALSSEQREILDIYNNTLKSRLGIECIYISLDQLKECLYAIDEVMRRKNLELSELELMILEFCNRIKKRLIKSDGNLNSFANFNMLDVLSKSYQT